MAKGARKRDSDAKPGAVVPFGYSGAGILTEHPVGIVVAVGVMAIGLEALPEARWFFAGTLALGAVWGAALWLQHRAR